MTDQSNTPVAAEGTPAHVLVTEFPNLEGARTIDLSAIPAETRMDLLKNAARAYIANRVNATVQRHNKDEKVLAWLAFDNAVKADALQTAVPKPEGERPAAPDLEAAYNAAVEALLKGEIRKQTGEGKARTKVDPLVKTVTDIVVRDVFESKRAADPKFTFLAAKAEVGKDGIEYLNKLIEAKVAAGVDRTALETMRDTKYINPAKVMLGLTENKKLKELPSIL